MTILKCFKKKNFFWKIKNSKIFLQPRLDGECTAVMRALNALREIMRIIELHNGVVGVVSLKIVLKI